MIKCLSRTQTPPYPPHSPPPLTAATTPAEVLSRQVLTEIGFPARDELLFMYVTIT